MTRSTVRPSDLTAEARRRYGLDAPKAGRKHPRPSRAGTGDGQPCPGRCTGPKGCGAQFGTYTAWERHSKQNGCRGRWEIDLPQGEASDEAV